MTRKAKKPARVRTKKNAKALRLERNRRSLARAANPTPINVVEWEYHAPRKPGFWKRVWVSLFGA